MPTQLEYFDSRRLALNRELQHHPDLWPLLAKHAPDKFEMKLAELASMFGIVLDGDYYPEDLSNLCEILTKKLYEKRTLIVLN